MIQSKPFIPDPELDLLLERQVDVPPELVWEAWTKPEHIKKFFVPRPWEITDCEIDLRPGGIFSSTMRSPEGEEYPNTGCYLEIVENEKLIWTSVLGPGFRPVAGPQDIPFTAVILLEPAGNGGTKYTALAIHGTTEVTKAHEQMGFHDGWGTVLTQLVEYVKSW